MPSLSSRIEGNTSYWVTSTPMRLHPVTPPLGVVTTPLSILDNSVARFSPTGAVFLFDTFNANDSSPYSPQSSPRFMANSLEKALEMVLREYPHFAGQLSWSPTENGIGGCVEVTYGKGEGADPGVGFEVVRLEEKSFGDFFDAEEREREYVKGRRDFLDAHSKEEGIKSEESDYVKLGEGFEPGNGVRVVEESMTELEPKGKLALWDLEQVEEDGVALPGVRIKVTMLGHSASGGYAVGIKMSHVLGDAQTLVGFMKRWAQHCRPLHLELEKRDREVGEPVFDPSTLNRAAEGIQDGTTMVGKVRQLLGVPKNLKDKRTDKERIADARKLPCHRFDWWKDDVEGYAEFLKSTTKKSRKLAPTPVDEKTSSTDVRTDMTAPPWHTWDLTKPCDHIEIYFSAKQLQKLKASCSGGPEPDGAQISRLDALLGYIWTRINHARFPPSSFDKTPRDSTVYLNLSLGARTRVTPPLPETFVGSPIFIANVPEPLSFFTYTTSSELSSAVAKRIRSTINQFTPQAVSDLLFATSQEAVPNRVWQAFLGQRHTLVTSWLRLGAGDVDFFGDNDGLPGRGRADVVRPIMPKMDGCVCIMEDVRKFRENEEGHKGGWMVSVYLEREAGKRLVGILERERAGDGEST